MTLAEYLAEVEARCAKATPGPWSGEGVLFWTEKNETELKALGFERGDPWIVGEDVIANEADTAFIAHARADVPRLLALLRRAAEGLDAVRHKGRLGVHHHWDSDLQSGLGCELCAEQRKARRELDACLADLARLAREGEQRQG